MLTQSLEAQLGQIVTQIRFKQGQTSITVLDQKPCYLCHGSGRHSVDGDRENTLGMISCFPCAGRGHSE